MTIAVCPGSFDPITMGHLDIFRRAARHVDELVVLVTGNPNKPSGLFTVEERIALIEESTKDIPHLRVDWWSGLLVDYTNSHGIDLLIKGLRGESDYAYELPMAQMNRRLSGIDTLFLVTDEKYSYISSSLCKEVAKYGGNIDGLFPEPVAQAVRNKL